MRESLQDFCIREGRQELLDQWVADKNLPITPAVISRGSKRKVWWHCEKGHNWQAAVYTRTGSGTGCPVCAGKVAQAGENDLAARFPELAHQWHPIRNGCLAPTQVLPGSHRTVWWMCKEGHEWRAQIKSRVSGSGCPVCTGRKVVAGENDLATLTPDVARQWHPVLNGTLTPQMVTGGSHCKVWWECEQGHVWQAAIYSRTGPKKCGCPICAGRVSQKRLKQYRFMELIHSAFAMQPTNPGDL